ncbi:hypothetical protein TorRG33x02_307580 [Trema orientale]|uniref:Uncharacterized protein n=1 Tax=Trema orientale TaxID=63057 RepID=A0A2P5BV91_TREOI|nr:hypothetical protein TorRG33x02_307580 [Trema orientale]
MAIVHSPSHYRFDGQTRRPCGVPLADEAAATFPTVSRRMTKQIEAAEDDATKSGFHLQLCRPTSYDHTTRTSRLLSLLPSVSSRSSTSTCRQ